jgi:hypothetical protein
LYVKSIPCLDRPDRGVHYNQNLTTKFLLEVACCSLLGGIRPNYIAVNPNNNQLSTNN